MKKKIRPWSVRTGRVVPHREIPAQLPEKLQVGRMGLKNRVYMKTSFRSTISVVK